MAQKQWTGMIVVVLAYIMNTGCFVTLKVRK
jgi:hypothetical protein